MTKKDMGIALWVVFLWSSNLIVQKIAVGHMSVFVLSFLRIAFVLPLLLLYPKPLKSMWKYAVCGFFISALYLILFGLGLKTAIGAGLSSFVLQLQVFFAILCCFLVLGEKPTWYQILGIFFSFIGIYFMKAASSVTEFPMVGFILLVGACLSYGIGIAYSKKYKVGGSIADITWMSVTAVVPLLLTCLVVEGPVETVNSIMNMPTVALLCILYATVISTIWGSSLWLSLLQRAPSPAVLPFTLLIPVFSNILSNVTLGETLSNSQMVAGCIIILGVMFAQGFHQYIPSFAYWIKRKIA